MEAPQIGTTFNIGDVGTKALGESQLHALIFWCKTYDKDNIPTGPNEASRLNHRELVPLGMDLETSNPVVEKMWFSFGTLFFLSLMAVLAGFLLVYKAYTLSFNKKFRQVRAGLRLRQDRCSETQNNLIATDSCQCSVPFLL